MSGRMNEQTPSQKYDVIVVGSGPAGSTTARFLAREGFKVKILEAKSHVGIPVQCGEAMGKDTIEDILKLDIPKYVFRTEIDGFRVFSPSLNTIEYRLGAGEGYIVDRRVFDKELLIGAVQEGADIQINTRVKSIKIDPSEGVTLQVERKGKEGLEKAPVVVGADGIYSTVARDAGLAGPIDPKDLDTSVGYEMVGVEIDEPTMFDLYMGTEVAPRGYLWVFPKGEHSANVGIGVGVGFGKKSVKEYLDDFIYKHPEGKRRFKHAKIIEERIGAIPVGGSLKRLATDRVLLVGDAARQVNPLTGGGIAYGMEAGEMVSKTLVKAFEEENFTEKFLRKHYEKQWNNAYGKSFSLGSKARKILDVITDEQMEHIVEAFSGEDLTKAVTGKWAQIKLGTKLMKKDASLVKLLREALKD
ncbi:NAD(P)/FAD-dependent oxidoreductase [Candidatus Heimdallarchaeota archaeon]|nr:MAG: NAD(P)/FAD-dependent oxidoreductase [Candidatus Heimdallarchaeota archaeon]RLI71933.1 MAG: NAD(P)/FAD-dependent oxidoreductase [Candidatus Gerdarchaeota archaeon]